MMENSQKILAQIKKKIMEKRLPFLRVTKKRLVKSQSIKQSVIKILRKMAEAKFVILYLENQPKNKTIKQTCCFTI